MSNKDINDFLQKRIESGEILRTDELHDLATKADDLNHIQINTLYAVLLEEHAQAKILPPTENQAISAIWGRIRQQNLQAGDVITPQAMFNDGKLYDRYGPELLKAATNNLIERGWIKQDEKSSILTQEGYRNL